MLLKLTLDNDESLLEELPDDAVLFELLTLVVEALLTEEELDEPDCELDDDELTEVVESLDSELVDELD